MIRDALDSVFSLAFKADVPPTWWTNSRQLSRLLQGQWNLVSSDFLSELHGAFLHKDFDHMAELADAVDALGPKMSAGIDDRLEAILESAQNKAIAAYALHGKHDLGLHRLKEFDGDYKTLLTELHAEQIRNFTELNPSRILHPEIERQLGYIRDTDFSRSIDIDLISQKLERIVKQEPYWGGLSDVQVSRLWHQDGFKLAAENGVDECYVSGPDDAKTCIVCQRMLGTRLSVRKSMDKFDKDGSITDPDEYVAAWPFPRFEDIDNISATERAEIGGSPPFHLH